MIIVTTTIGDTTFDGPELSYTIDALGILHILRGECFIASYREWLSVKKVFDTEA